MVESLEELVETFQASGILRQYSPAVNDGGEQDGDMIERGVRRQLTAAGGGINRRAHVAVDLGGKRSESGDGRRRQHIDLQTKSPDQTPGPVRARPPVEPLVTEMIEDRRISQLLAQSDSVVEPDSLLSL